MMGEYADMAIDDMLSYDEYLSLDEDNNSDQAWSPFTRFTRRKTPTCNHCGMTNLYWQNDNGWYLAEYDLNKRNWFRHICKMGKFNTSSGTSSRQTRVISLTV